MERHDEKRAAAELASCSRPDLAAAVFGGAAIGTGGPEFAAPAPEGRLVGEVAKDLSVGLPLSDSYASAPPTDVVLRDNHGALQIGSPMDETDGALQIGSPMDETDVVLRDNHGALQIGSPMDEIGAVPPVDDLLVDPADVLSVGPNLYDAAATAAASEQAVIIDPAQSLSIASAGDNVGMIARGAEGFGPSVGQLLEEDLTLTCGMDEEHPDYVLLGTKSRGRTGHGKPVREQRKGANIRRGGMIGGKDGRLHPTF